MFTLSAQSRSWMFKSSSELNRRRESANNKFIQRHSKGMSKENTSKYFLTVAEEKMLCKHYESILMKFCQKFQPPMPKNVIACSFHYFKRFYLNNSVMDYHPKDILVTCAYLASKVEEFNVSIYQFVANVKGDREKATEIILNHELLLMQQLNFDLSVYNALRPVEGFLIDIKTRYPTLNDPEHLRPAIEEFLEKIHFTDACFLYSPSQIALAAIAYGAHKFRENIDGYMEDILFDGYPDKLSYVLEAIKTMFLMIKNETHRIKDQHRAAIEKKLEKCRNQENNPSNIAYKRKLEELQDEEDDGPAMKYSKILENQEADKMEAEQSHGITFFNSSQ
ncbi:cyclin-H [Parasteatoda tepidariorum]|uniref:cyclin-H n=1 Tax=Parasteatoda tepidariorum TaxID=114398 RepID=UPI00077F8DE7|nr:cyclin-H [Parasteatoda tepidariorum]XP_015906452.1 cyclin-H [Parasteatoda tepidariorum]XP_015906453.1 cyclin-H [Parasteatoda tepidariorum]XP_042904036.1 cyclin-H [Parasteatoda tepidariorum]